MAPKKSGAPVWVTSVAKWLLVPAALLATGFYLIGPRVARRLSHSAAASHQTRASQAVDIPTSKPLAQAPTHHNPVAIAAPRPPASAAATAKPAITPLQNQTATSQTTPGQAVPSIVKTPASPARPATVRTAPVRTAPVRTSPARTSTTITKPRSSTASAGPSISVTEVESEKPKPKATVHRRKHKRKKAKTVTVHAPPKPEQTPTDDGSFSGTEEGSQKPSGKTSPA